MYLLDTNIVSELRRSDPHGGVLAWFRGIRDEQLCLSAVTIGEIQAGIEITREQNPVKAAELEDWLGQVLGTFDILPVDAAAFREWAGLMHRQSETLSQDALIGAVATVHRLRVATRNVRDFERLGVETMNPFAHGEG
ncbi:type II toxin-antitoxin system VapC family toxin [Candidatus Palauibacter sp.]|uniref:type II toxin-antitoxin system VapC family toxin n=1 Tax=Candidatus Palauibacter sp. TaxID=3101350 RepID=UPI003C6F7DCE